MPQDNRKKSSPNQEQILFAEANGLCPLCGKSLMQIGRTKNVKQYEIAHIYPCNPTAKDISVLSSVSAPADTEAMDNKIALCLSCHKVYDDDKTLERYNELRNIKNRFSAENSIRSIIGEYHLESDISDILSKLLIVDDEILSSLSLSITALKIREKVEDEYSLLRRNIESNVTKYYAIVQKMLKEMGTDKFDNIAIQIKSFYKKCYSLTQDKNIIFNQISQWIQSKSKNDNKIACEIVASFFVQNCEVFDAITK